MGGVWNGNSRFSRRTTLRFVAVDPNACVLVGAGQSIDRISRGESPTGPLELILEAVATADQNTSAKESVLPLLQSLRVVRSFGSTPHNFPQVIADTLGVQPTELVLSSHGGTMPQKFLADAALAMAKGSLDCVAIVGGERMAGVSAGVPEASTEQEDMGATRLFGDERTPLTRYELARGLRLPAFIYPLLETAYRARQGRTLSDHREVLGALWQHFAEVAASNPYAWIQSAPSAADIVTPGEANRMIPEPYTKTMVANLPVNQAACVIAMRYEAALAAGIPRDAMVFFHGHSVANDPWFVSNRLDLGRSIALEAASTTLFEYVNASSDDMGLIDLYSCFPVAVELSAQALGLSLHDPQRPLTLTGGLTFAGGPGNSYVLHSLAAMVASLREQREMRGLISGLSYFATSHSLGVYGTHPSNKAFASLDAQAVVDRADTKVVDESFVGSGTIETFTVTHARDTGPKAVIAAVTTPQGARCWSWTRDPEFAASVSGKDLLGVPCSVDAEGRLSLD